MALVPFSLSAALKAIGNAEVFIGDPFTAGAMLSLGAVEGEIGVDISISENRLTAPELTGDIPHAVQTMIGDATVTVPVIVGDPTLWAKIHPTGGQSGGWSGQQTITPTSVLVLPRSELGGGLSRDATAWTRTAGNGVLGATGATAAPVNAVWLWKAYPTFSRLPYRFADGGKVLVDVTFHAMFDAARPEGHKVYTIGDPRAATPTPIAVLI